jgi:hypothetical protein
MSSVSDRPACITPVVVVRRAELRESDTATVAQDEEAFAEMGVADIGGGKHVPLRIEPAVGQVAEYGGQSSSENNGRYVFQPDNAGFHLANAISDVGPDPALVIEPVAAASGAPRLTREACRDDIHDAAPRSAIKRGNVVPDRRRIQRAVCHTRDQAGRSKIFPLHEEAAGVEIAEYEPQAEFKSAHAGADRDAVQLSGR